MQLILSATDNCQVHLTKCTLTPRGSLHPPYYVRSHFFILPLSVSIPPTVLFLSALSQPMHIHSSPGAAKKRSYVPWWQELISNFLHNNRIVPSDYGNLAHVAGIQLGAVNQRDGCLRQRRLTDVRQSLRCCFSRLKKATSSREVRLQRNNLLSVLCQRPI